MKITLLSFIFIISGVLNAATVVKVKGAKVMVEVDGEKLEKGSVQTFKNGDGDLVKIKVKKSKKGKIIGQVIEGDLEKGDEIELVADVDDEGDEEGDEEDEFIDLDKSSEKGVKGRVWGSYGIGYIEDLTWGASLNYFVTDKVSIGADLQYGVIGLSSKGGDDMFLYSDFYYGIIARYFMGDFNLRHGLFAGVGFGKINSSLEFEGCCSSSFVGGEPDISNNYLYFDVGYLFTIMSVNLGVYYVMENDQTFQVQTESGSFSNPTITTTNHEAFSGTTLAITLNAFF